MIEVKEVDVVLVRGVHPKLVGMRVHGLLHPPTGNFSFLNPITSLPEVVMKEQYVDEV